MVERANHEASVLTSKLIGCLSDINGFKLVLLPECEKLFGNTERSSYPVNRHRSSLRQLLQDRLQMFLWSNFLISKCCWRRNLHRHYRIWLELLDLVYDVLCISVKDLTFVVLDKLVESTWAVATALCTWMCCDSHNTDTIELAKVRVLELLRDCPWDKITRWAKTSLQLLCNSFCTHLTFKTDLNGAKNVWKSVMCCGFI